MRRLAHFPFPESFPLRRRCTEGSRIPAVAKGFILPGTLGLGRMSDAPPGSGVFSLEEVIELWEISNARYGDEPDEGLPSVPLFRVEEGGLLVLVLPIEMEGGRQWEVATDGAYCTIGRNLNGRSVVFYWVGREASPAVVATATIRAMELSRAVSGGAATYREDEELESLDFLEVLGAPLQVGEMCL